jgi:hypothetical protein
MALLTEKVAELVKVTLTQKKKRSDKNNKKIQ